MIKNSNFEHLQKSLLSREAVLFNTSIKDKYDWAVNDTSRRGVLGPGVGAAFVEHELTKAIRERMKDVAVELAEVDLNKNKLGLILEAVFDQYIVQAESLLNKPAVWGHLADGDSKRYLKQWTEITKPALWSYFESEFRAVLTKRSISKKTNVRETLLWLVIGATISRSEELITFAEKMITALKSFATGQ